MNNNFLRRLMSTVRCSVCGRRYVAGNVNVLGRRNEIWFLSVFCPSCQSQGLVAAVVKEEKAGEPIVELREVAKEGRDEKPVEIDEVLDMHNFLKNFDGDLARLFDRS